MLAQCEGRNTAHGMAMDAMASCTTVAQHELHHCGSTRAAPLWLNTSCTTVAQHDLLHGRLQTEYDTICATPYLRCTMCVMA